MIDGVVESQNNDSQSHRRRRGFAVVASDEMASGFEHVSVDGVMSVTMKSLIYERSSGAG